MAGLLDGRAVRRLAALALVAGLATAACAPAERGITLRFWAMGAEGEQVQALTRRFEQEHPGVRVQVQQLPWSAAHEKLLTCFVGGSTPDVTQLGNTWISEFEALRALEPLGPWVARSPGIADTSYFAGVWDSNVVDGELYGIPWYVDTRLIFYRRDLLAAAGYERMPGTWAEWEQALVALKRTMGEGRWPIFLPLNEWNVPIILGQQKGASLVNPAGTRGEFSSPAFREAFAFYVSLFRNGLAPAISNNEIANIYQEMERGHVAMWVTGPWNLGQFRDRFPAALAGAWSTAPMPGPDGPGSSTAGGASLAMFRASKHKAEAWALIEFLSRPENQLEFWQLSGDLPARVETWRDSRLAGDPRTRAFGDQLARTRPLPMLPEAEQIVIRLQDWMDRTVRGRLPVDSALAGLDRDVDRMLAKRRWLAEHRPASPRALTR